MPRALPATTVTQPLRTSPGTVRRQHLATDQQQLCRQFAVTGGDKFAGVEWHPGSNGAPLLNGALATIECELVDTFPGGDHVIVLGRITALDPADRPRETGPLLYYRRTYGRLR
ncbi:flavin reductase family protein [Streptomyces sp. NPDC057543]|uniref:flavin reductase family protein n=1 Tax=Streptomyces sp. NPDC057543 TaxID=3346163 RepID=UPI00369ADE88